MARRKRYWHIVGYDSTTMIYEDKVLLGCYTEHEMGNLFDFDPKKDFGKVFIFQLTINEK